MGVAEAKVHRFSVSTVSQGNYRFYTLSMPTDVLTNTTFVSSRDEDPKLGFQRLLDRKRAQQIADYVDEGHGTIPTSIILSAQPDANFRIIGEGKTAEFKSTNKAFLILDGQHRVYGFALAKTKMRVPVVIYTSLSRRDESRLFIDINTTQRAVPNELLLDIRKLAEYQNDLETLIGEVYDLFRDKPSSPLQGMLAPNKKTKGKLSRVTFNAAIKSVIDALDTGDSERIFKVLAPYLKAFLASAEEKDLASTFVNPVVFRAAIGLFPEVAQRVHDKFGNQFTSSNFQFILSPMFDKLKSSNLKKPGNSVNNLQKIMSNALHSQFRLSDVI